MNNLQLIKFSKIMKKYLPKENIKILNRYLAIKVGKWRVRCPYYMNEKKMGMLNPVDCGKGLPEEIEKRINKNYLRVVNNLKNENDAVDLLKTAKIGIDCSGLVCNILGIKRVHQSNFLMIIKAAIRPRTNISADMLTSWPNAFPILLSKIRPGDLIRQGKNHVMLIEWTERARNSVISLGYIESNTSPKFGVQKGGIRITDPTLSLEEQEWSEPLARNRYAKSLDKGIVRINKT